MKRPIGDLPKKYWAIAAGAAAYLADLIHPTWITALPVLALMGYALFRQFRSPVQYVTGDRYTRITRLALLSIAFLFFLARAWAFGRDFQSKEAIIGLGKTPGAYAFDLIFLATLTLSWLLGRLTARAFLFFKTIWRRPAAVLSGSFALLIAIGAMLLMLPVSLQRIEDVSFVNALFTATSAVCVTGLTVADISTTYSVFGQVVILAAIQFGAIGIMTVAAMAFFLSKEGSLVPEQRLLTVLGANSLRDLHRTVWTIAIVTLVLETVGAAALYFLLSGDARLRGDSAIFVSIFHSISAFANAGFSLFPDNLESFRRDAAVQTVILLLVSAGGLGFPVLWALLGKWTRVKWRIVHEIRLLLGARVALKASVLLVIFGAAAFSALESSGAFLSLDAPERMLAALFTSVTSRTAGFHSVPISAMQPASLMVLMLLMFIGGSPGGTAGGIKTTTAAVLAATFRGELRRQPPELQGRSISQETIRRSVSIVAMSGTIVFGALFFLVIFEPFSFLSLAFETVSAFGTVGLSTGITPLLGIPGKLILVTVMFAGRVGPLTIAVAIGSRYRVQKHVFPTEDLPVG